MSAAIVIARRLAAAHPGAELPCPECAATVHAPNLERHLAKVHAAPLAAARELDPTVVSGTDRGLRRPMLGLLAGWTIACVVAAAARVVTGDAAFAIAGAGFVVCLVPLVLALLGVFKARIELAGDTVRLSWALGLGSRVIRLPAELESGRLLERRTVPGTHQLESAPAEDVDAGAYLRLSSGGRALVLGVGRGAGLGARWARVGWRAAAKTRRWDVTLDRIALLAVEYHLAARGLLVPRARIADGPAGR